MFARLRRCSCDLSAWVVWTLNIMLVSERGDKMLMLAPVAASDYIVRVGALALNSWPRHSGLRFSPAPGSL